MKAITLFAVTALVSTGVLFTGCSSDTTGTNLGRAVDGDYDSYYGADYYNDGSDMGYGGMYFNTTGTPYYGTGGYGTNGYNNSMYGNGGVSGTKYGDDSGYSTYMNNGYMYGTNR